MYEEGRQASQSQGKDKKQARAALNSYRRFWIWLGLSLCDSGIAVCHGSAQKRREKTIPFYFVLYYVRCCLTFCWLKARFSNSGMLFVKRMREQSGSQWNDKMMAFSLSPSRSHSAQKKNMMMPESMLKPFMMTLYCSRAKLEWMEWRKKYDDIFMSWLNIFLLSYPGIESHFLSFQFSLPFYSRIFLFVNNNFPYIFLFFKVFFFLHFIVVVVVVVIQCDTFSTWEDVCASLLYILVNLSTIPVYCWE